MSITITRHWGSRRGDSTAMCSVCGVNWRRSTMRRDNQGRLLCPDDSPGRNSLTLDRLNAEGGQRRMLRTPEEAAGMDTDDGLTTPPQRLTIEDIESGV